MWERRSGCSRVHRRRGREPFFLSAFASLADPACRTYYDKKISKSKHHTQALLCLARRRADVLFAMLRDGTCHDPNPPLRVDETPRRSQRANAGAGPSVGRSSQVRLEFARLTDTVLIHGDGVYDLGEFNDTLVLGLKSTMSEAELHIPAGRLGGGQSRRQRPHTLCRRGGHRVAASRDRTITEHAFPLEMGCSRRGATAAWWRDAGERAGRPAGARGVVIPGGPDGPVCSRSRRRRGRAAVRG